MGGLKREEFIPCISFRIWPDLRDLLMPLVDRRVANLLDHGCLFCWMCFRCGKEWASCTSARTMVHCWRTTAQFGCTYLYWHVHSGVSPRFIHTTHQLLLLHALGAFVGLACWDGTRHTHDPRKRITTTKASRWCHYQIRSLSGHAGKHRFTNQCQCHGHGSLS